MLQIYASLLHLNVYDDVAFGLHFEKPGSVSQKSDNDRVTEALDFITLGLFGERRATELQGGEQQPGVGIKLDLVALAI